MYTVYGIPNCDTIKKTIQWLRRHKIPFRFHNFKIEGITPAKLAAWSQQVGWEVLLNKRGTTWRELDPGVRSSVIDNQSAAILLAAYTSVIKRPVIEKGQAVIVVGFDERAYEKIFGK